MAKILSSSVYVTDDDGNTRLFNPGDKLPAWATKAITNPAAWTEVPDEEPTPTQPPQGSQQDTGESQGSGEGQTGQQEGEQDGENPADQPPAGNASLEAWTAYAKSRGASDADLAGKGRDELREQFGHQGN